jgi:signal transduction histidine kinase
METESTWFPRAKTDLIKYGFILLLILLISIFHFKTPTEYRYLHEIYQRVYYIPILLAAFWYGPLIGFISALMVSLVYVVHIEMDWHHVPVYTFNQYAEICLYHLLALIIGFLALKERNQRRKLEQTSKKLGEAYDQLQNTFEQLRKADRLAALGQLSAGIAHEIRNPLGSVKGSIEILESEIPNTHPKHEFVKIIKEETARLNSIVSEFLKFARPPSPKVEPTSINNLVESTFRLVQKEAQQAQIQIRKNLDSRLPFASLDKDQIRQVLLNVYLNAIQAMPDGGILQISTHSSRKNAIIEIADSGIGIEEDELQHIFNPFFSTKSDGTGMGLSVSYQLVENHGGRISAKANISEGLTFTIELPHLEGAAT